MTQGFSSSAKGVAQRQSLAHDPLYEYEVGQQVVFRGAAGWQLGVIEEFHSYRRIGKGWRHYVIVRAEWGCKAVSRHEINARAKDIKTPPAFPAPVADVHPVAAEDASARAGQLRHLDVGLQK